MQKFCKPTQPNEKKKKVHEKENCSEVRRYEIKRHSF